MPQIECAGADIWHELSTKAWRRILQESNDCGDVKRAEYARWMLKDILDEEA